MQIFILSYNLKQLIDATLKIKFPDQSWHGQIVSLLVIQLKWSVKSCLRQRNIWNKTSYIQMLYETKDIKQAEECHGKKESQKIQ